MKLESCFLLLLHFGLTRCQAPSTDNDHEVKRGMYPYMAFIYFSDPTVVDVTGQRFVRSAVLIRPDWLVTTALGPSLVESPGFPTKTLLARTGAISIDSKFTLNEDEDEQEREIVQIVRPFNYSATQWWTTDISLMKTLLPFNMTSAVGFKILKAKKDAIDPKTCGILVYVRMHSNATENKNLMMLFVELLPPSMENCGSHFAASTMTCAADSDENKDAVYDPDFCHGNSGGPLICENEVVGLQTYIGNNCKQPYLYQLLFAWDNFITCSIEDKCREEQCNNICHVTYKDPPKVAARTSATVTYKSLGSTSGSISSSILNSASNSTSNTVSIKAPSDTATLLDDVINTVVTTTLTNLVETTTKEPLITIHPTLTMMTETLTPTATEPVEVTTAITQTSSISLFANTVSSWPKIKESAEMHNTTRQEPKQKDLPTKGSVVQQIRLTHVESQKSQLPKQPQRRPKQKPVASNSNMCFIQTMFFGLTALLCL